MKATDREALAYDIRRDAEYTRQRLVELRYADSPTVTATVWAAHGYATWCDAASDELLNNPHADVDELHETWRREAAHSDVRFIPFANLAACVVLGCWIGSLAALAAWGPKTWIAMAVMTTVAVAAFGYRQWMPPRLAVGPDARSSILAKASTRDLLNSGGRPPQQR